MVSRVWDIAAGFIPPWDKRSVDCCLLRSKGVRQNPSKGFSPNETAQLPCFPHVGPVVASSGVFREGLVGCLESPLSRAALPPDILEEDIDEHPELLLVPLSPWPGFVLGSSARLSALVGRIGKPLG